MAILAGVFTMSHSPFCYMAPERWKGRSTLEKALTWIAYGIVRVGMGVLGYGGNEWFPRKRRRNA